MSTAGALPRSGRLLIGGVIALGLVGALAWSFDVGTWTWGDALACAGVLAATALSERFPLELHYRRERDVYSLSDAIWTAGVLLMRPSALVLAVGVGAVLGQALLGRAPVKIAFNAGQFVLGISAAVGVFALLGSPGPDTPAGWLAVALAMAAFQAVNTVLVAAVIAALEERPLRQMLLASTGRLHWAGNVAAGILGALIWTASPLALPLLVVPIALTSLAYRDWLRTLQERDWMARMSQAADTIVTSGDLTKRIDPVGAPGEDGAVAHLGLTLNRMLSRLERSFTRERTFIRQSSHDLRTPITICRGHLEVMSPEPSRAELEETRELVLDELARMARIVDDMEDLAFMEDPASLRRRTVELDRFVSELTAKAAPLLGSRLRAQPDVPRDELRADPQRLTQALINLLRNAREHTPAETPIDLRVVRDNGSWRFEVADHGGGLAADHEERVFEPFFKREHSAGSGLGLAIVSGIARAHGGTAGLDNRQGEGATFWVRIPR